MEDFRASSFLSWYSGTRIIGVTGREGDWNNFTLISQLNCVGLYGAHNFFYNESRFSVCYPSSTVHMDIGCVCVSW